MKATACCRSGRRNLSGTSRMLCLTFDNRTRGRRARNAESSSILPHEHRRLSISRGLWDVQCSDDKLVLSGSIRVSSLTPAAELFIPEVQCNAIPVSRHSFPLSSSDIVQRIRIGEAQTTSIDALVSPEATLDATWRFPSVPILRQDEAIHIPVHMTFEGSALTYMNELWIEVELDVYGPHGVDQERQDVVLPLKCPPLPILEDQSWSPCPHMVGAETLPVSTHLLCHLDDPAAVVEHYAAEAARSQGDAVVCIAESALAIMQGRWRHYKALRPCWLARVGCRLFSPLSSMASACGLQAAICLVGQLRVALAIVLGGLAKLIGISGIFYKVVGRAATAIDDLTGTLAPYDRCVVFGPDDPCAVVHNVEERTGLKIAVVDVNDLSKSTGGVSILSHSSSVDPEDLKRAIMHNPGGNADQQTPLLLVRGMHSGN